MQHNPVGARTAQARTAGGGAARGRERFDDAQRPWSLFALLSVCALLVGWIALSAATDEAASLLVYGLANLIVFMDAIVFGVRLYVHRQHTAVPSEPGRGETYQPSIDLAAARSAR